MSRTSIKVVGLTDPRKGLRGIDSGLPKSIRRVLNAVTGDLIDAVQPKIPRRTGKAAASLKAQSSQGQARIAAGGPKAPYYPWLDFGGRTGRRRSVVRPFFSEGLYIFPTLAERREEIEQSMLDGLTDLSTASGIEVD